MDEEAEYWTDSKYKQFTSAVDKTLKSFEYSSEWADLISCLGKLNKVISLQHLYTEKWSSKGGGMLAYKVSYLFPCLQKFNLHIKIVVNNLAHAVTTLCRLDYYQVTFKFTDLLQTMFYSWEYACLH